MNLIKLNNKNDWILATNKDLYRNLNIFNKSLTSIKNYSNDDIKNIFELANRFRIHRIKYSEPMVNYNH